MGSVIEPARGRPKGTFSRPRLGASSRPDERQEEEGRGHEVFPVSLRTFAATIAARLLHSSQFRGRLLCSYIASSAVVSVPFENLWSDFKCIGEVYCSRLCFRSLESFEVADPVFSGKRKVSMLVLS